MFYLQMHKHEILFISRVTIWSVFQNPVTFNASHKNRVFPKVEALGIAVIMDAQ